MAWETQRKLRSHCCSENLSLESDNSVYTISILKEYFLPKNAIGKNEHLAPSSFVTQFLIDYYYKFRDSWRTEMDPSPRKVCDPDSGQTVFITCCFAVQSHDYLDKTSII